MDPLIASPASPPVDPPTNPPAACVSLGIDIGGTGVKLAALADNQILWTEKRTYRFPTVQDLVHAISGGMKAHPEKPTCVGLCVPGILDEKHERVAYSVNVPALMEIQLADLINAAVGLSAGAAHVVNDAVATGFDIYSGRALSGRLLTLAIGTGVGASVLDDGVPLNLVDDAPGHIGMMDVSVAGDRVVGPDGGAGSLEGYVGAAALRQYYGSNPSQKARPNDAPIRALVKAIRICHAIYRPHHVVLAGGFGIRLGRILQGIRKRIETDLTSVAREGWTLDVGDSDFHAACGAARWAVARS